MEWYPFILPYFEEESFRRQRPPMFPVPFVPAMNEFQMANSFYPWYQKVPNPYPSPQNLLSDSIFEDPLDPGVSVGWGKSQFPEFPFYPVPPRPFVASPPSGVHLLLDSFKGKDGQIDFNKILSTTGQLMGMVNQISGLIKGFATMFKQ